MTHAARSIRPALAASVALLAVAALVACGGQSATGPAGGCQPVVATASSPANGNATLDALVVVIEHNIDIGGVMHTAVRTTQTQGAIDHLLDVYFVTATGAIYSVQDSWVENPVPPGVGGFTGCDGGGGTPCPSAQVSVNVTTRVITFTNLVISGAAGPPAVTTTLNGQICY